MISVKGLLLLKVSLKFVLDRDFKTIRVTSVSYEMLEIGKNDFTNFNHFIKKCMRENCTETHPNWGAGWLSWWSV